MKAAACWVKSHPLATYVALWGVALSVCGFRYGL